MLEKLFRDQVKKYTEITDFWDKKDRLYSNFRLGLFVIFLVLGYFLLQANAWPAIIAMTVLLVAVFIFLVIKQSKIRFQRDLNGALKKVNLREIDIIDHNWEAIDNGSEFETAKHPYTYDLDIFGKGSLFQLINRSAFYQSRKLLGERLNKQVLLADLLDIQTAVKELAPKLEWRQNLQALGQLSEVDPTAQATFFSWLNEDEDQIKIPKWAFVSVAITLLLIIAKLFIDVPVALILVFLAINGFILFRIQETIQAQQLQTENGMKSLRGPIEMIKKIEGSSFESKRLQDLKVNLINDYSSLSQQLQSLDKRLNLLHSRANMFYHLFNFILLIDLVALQRLKSWKSSFKEQHEEWLDTLAEIEYIASLSAVAHNHPDFVFPKIAEKPYQIIGKDLGHPMISKKQRVANSFECDHKQIFLITGSNMSGKSTFLRTIGINTILGRLGSVVCASSFTISDFVLFTVMRTEDNLDENISSFYAELKRIRQMLEFIESEERVVLVLMDEILKGTNSADRNNGTQGLIGQLDQEEALSFISTHDLTLATLPEVINYNFSSDIIDGKIIFDYRIKDGVCKSFNASELMKQIGIRIEED